MFVYLNGKFVKEKKAKISVFDCRYLYGDGIFETLRVYKGKIFALKDHINRLFASSKTIMLEIPQTKEEIKKLLFKTVKINNIKEGRLRISIFRENGDLRNKFNLKKNLKPIIIIIASNIDKKELEKLSRGVEVKIVTVRRNCNETLFPQVKSLNCLNNILATIEVDNAHPIFLNNEGYITEGSYSNIFIVKNKNLFTPPIYMGILPGVTRKIVLKLASFLKIPVYESVLTSYELITCEEAFLTYTTFGIIPIVKVNGQLINHRVGKITKKLITEYEKLHR